MMQAIRITAVLVVLALFVTGCATTEQFIQASPGMSATNQALATIRFKRKSVFFGSGWNLYVIDSGITDNTNGIVAKLLPQPSPPVAVLWPPDRLGSIGYLRLGSYAEYEVVATSMDDPEPELQVSGSPFGSLYEGEIEININPLTSKSVYRMSLETGFDVGLLHFPRGSHEFTLNVMHRDERVTFRKVSVVGKTANDGVLSWQRPAGRFQVVVYLDGLYYESPVIDARPGETTFVEFDLSEKSFNIIPGSKGK
ncbi:MAG TPA: hypothetical protein ENJ84_15410 [Gammaproteobacteria bacterium]|nr:hypothetical protein [Gammaproteobacteria bacterium]